MRAAHDHAKCMLLMIMPFMYALLYMLAMPPSLVTEQSCDLPELPPIRQTSCSTPADNSSCCVLSAVINDLSSWEVCTKTPPAFYPYRIVYVIPP